jgi:hypothetical protein
MGGRAEHKTESCDDTIVDNTPGRGDRDPIGLLLKSYGIGEGGSSSPARAAVGLSPPVLARAAAGRAAGVRVGAHLGPGCGMAARASRGARAANVRGMH